MGEYGAQRLSCKYLWCSPSCPFLDRQNSEHMKANNPLFYTAATRWSLNHHYFRKMKIPVHTSKSFQYNFCLLITEIDSDSWIYSIGKFIINNNLLFDNTLLTLITSQISPNSTLYLLLPSFTLLQLSSDWLSLRPCLLSHLSWLCLSATWICMNNYHNKHEPLT